MQTFLPYSDFHITARTLDYRRLGKQRVEAYQILKCLLGRDPAGIPNNSNAWKHHPATLMWRGHEYALAAYGLVITLAWINRGYRDTMKSRFDSYLSQLTDTGMPKWMGNTRLHTSHMMKLVQKDSKYYAPLRTELRSMGFSNADIMSGEYFWPVKINECH